MKTIAFITRVHPKRATMLEACVDSIKMQSDNDYIHIIHRDDKTENGYGLLLANQSFAKLGPINARYVMAIDDDDLLIDLNFVKTFRDAVCLDNPEIVFFKCRVIDKVFPLYPNWRQPPRRGRISGSGFAVRKDVWEKHIHEFGRKSCGDYSFL